ncbi:hemolysin family protein [Tuwongella immobilis]|uniref:CNNM transmembrane domain-containing protein n=1 Tax=Tuwongella immobilis TaxID=692036 RepID=A0A6C2YIJ9_9BACT|nr:hemolysin family protein [Tuwongella immobilis]VIP01368.1 Uncharacterized protein OS=Methylobacterium radiotolerans (strain ATCC 27329 / DSM 1819 / JCM 2831) GN=Mrad2831_0295 PE=4 SV=1: DUF21: CBS [Tuwongella immobilis]VTR98197.1 Uncharacterized protein OS=Methylobacterium radiotolerans (strain ATCC 27329 / DSM 1819 / JCM 2831) GN=Mrad2831_0295 PE=4 SV=1: DUF21: CBS [Tuwongella immobilis]
MILFADADPVETSNWVVQTLSLLAIPVLVALNGFFVAAEFALVAIRRTRVEEMVQKGVPQAKAVNYACEHLDRTIAATQLGITIASIALGWVGEPVLAHLMEPLFSFLPPTWKTISAHGFATVIAFTIITFMHVVFGELMPKTVALQAPERTALWVAAPLIVFARITRPIIVIMNGTGNQLLKLCGFKPGGTEASVHSVEELSLLMEDVEEAGLLDADQVELVQNVFELTDKTVMDCMIPREKMACLDLNASSEQIMDAVRAGAHTRMPVFDGTLDNIVGIVNTKDLFYLFSLSGLVRLEDALYPATYLDPAETVANALRLFRKSRRPMALVRNEDDQILGVLTLEDVLEEIVGELEDEHDRPVAQYQRRGRRILRARFNNPGKNQPTNTPPTKPGNASKLNSDNG